MASVWIEPAETMTAMGSRESAAAGTAATGKRAANITSAMDKLSTFFIYLTILSV
jgi:hypothetical protein